MSEYIDERIVSIKFDNSGFEQKVSETQKSLNELNKSLEFDGAKNGAEELTSAFKEISAEAKKTDLSPISESVETVKSKFSVLETVAVGALIKIGGQAVELGEKLIKSISIDPISQGFNKYQDILTSQMTLTAALGGETEEEIAANAALIEDVLDELAWYADETSYSLNDMIRNVSQFANYGVDLEDAKVAMMGIANASAKSGAPLASASHAMEGFSKAMGQGYMTYQTWRSWLNNSRITTLDFKNTFIETAKEMIKQGAVLSDKVRLTGDALEYYAGKNQGWLEVTADNLEQSLTKGMWMTSDVMLAGLSKYSAAMDDLYEATNHGTEAVSTLLETSEEGFDKFSLQAFLYAQQCKTLNDVVDALFDATSTTWYRIFKSLIGDYKQTVELWSNFAEYLFSWFVYPLQEVAEVIKEFSESQSKIMDKTTKKAMTMREVIVDSFMNILEAITSVINPIKEAFNAVFNPLETLPKKLQNGVEKFHAFTESLILTEEEAVNLRNKFITIFYTLQKIWSIAKLIIDTIKKYFKPIIETVGKYTISLLTSIGKFLLRIVSLISSTISQVFGVSDFVSDIKDKIEETTEAIEELKNTEREKTNFLDEYKSHKDYIAKYVESLGDAKTALEDLEEEEKEKKNPNIIEGGYTGESYLSYYQAIEEANNKLLAEFIKENEITEEQYTAFINLMDARSKGYKVYYDDFVKVLDGNEELAKRLTNIINDSMAAYISTAKAIDDIKKRELGDSGEEYQTVLDGIYYAQQRTLVKQGELDKLVDLYFNKGIKDTAQIAKELDIEEWKVRELTSAYEEAISIETYLNKRKLKATTENIKLARAELGYIKKTNSEEDKKYKTEAERNAALRKEAAERRREELLSGKSSSRSFTPSKDVENQINKSTQAINGYSDTADETTKSIEKIGDATTKSFNIIKDSIDTIKDKIKEIAPDLGKTLDKVNPIVEEKVSNLIDAIKKKFNIPTEIKNGVSSSVLEVENAESKIAKSSKETSKVVESDNKKVEKSYSTLGKKASKLASAVKDVNKEIKDGSDKASEEADDTLDELEFGIDDFIINSEGKISEFFGYIKDFFVYTDFSDLKDKLIEAGNYIKDFFVYTDFSSIGNDIAIVFEYTKNRIVGFIKGIFSEIKEKGFKEYFSPIISEIKNIEFFKDVFNIIKEKVEDLWERFSNYIKSKANEIRNDENNPFNWILYVFDRISEWFGNLDEKVKSKFKTINTFFKSLFGEGSFSEKMGDSSIFGPIFDIISSLLDKLDQLYRGIKNVKNLIRKEIDDAETKLHSSVNKIKSDIEDFQKAWKLFVDDIRIVRAYLNGDEEKKEDAEKAGGLAFIIGKILSKWDEFKTKTQDGLDWETIVKVDELERILERLIKAVTGAYLKIAFGSIALEIGKIFASVANAINTLLAPIAKKKDIGKILIEISIAIAILAASFYELSKLDYESIDKASAALRILAFTLKSMMTMITGILYLMQRQTIKAGSFNFSDGINGIFESIFGQKNTMVQAGKLIVATAAGLWILVKAFGKLANIVGSLTPEEIERTENVLMDLCIGFVLLLLAIQWIMHKFAGKNDHSGGKIGSLVGKIDIKDTNISKTATPAADMLKNFAAMLGVLIAGFLIVSFAINKFLTKENGEIDNAKLAAVATILATMALFSAGMMAFMTYALKEVKDIDNKTIKAFSGMLKPFIASIVVMVLMFQKMVKIVESIKKPDTLGKAVGVFAGIFLGIIIFMAVIMGLCKLLTGESSSISISESKTFLGAQSNSAMALFGSQKGAFEQINKTQKGELDKTIKEVSKIVIALGWGVKLIAQAFSTLVSAIDGIQNDGTFGKALGVFIGIILGISVMIGALIAAAYFMDPSSIDIIKSVGLVILEVAGAAVLIGFGIKMLAESFADIYKKLGDTGNELINKAIATIAIFIGSIVAIFAIIAALSGTGAGGALSAGVDIFVLLATGILLISAAVLIFAKGLETLVDVIIKASSANDSLGKGLDAIIKVLPKIKKVIIGVVRALVGGLFLAMREAKADIAIGIVQILVAILEALKENLPKIADALEELKEPMHRVLSVLREFIFDEIIAVIDFLIEKLPDIGDKISDFLYALGQYIPKLIVELPLAFFSGFVDALYNLIGINKDGNVTSKDDENSVFKVGVNVIKGLIEGIFEAIKGKVAGVKTLAGVAKLAWNEFKDSFTSKENADEKSPSKAAFKLGAYVGEGLVNGIESSAKAVSDSASLLSDSFMNPMKKDIKSFNAVTSSMLSQLIDADMDINPVITPVFDMTNIDYAAASMNRLFDSKNAVEVAASFNTMKLGQEMEKLNQNVGKTDTPAEPTVYNYTQNNYSPKALSPIEIYRRTHNQLTVAKNLAYGDKEGWVLSK